MLIGRDRLQSDRQVWILRVGLRRSLLEAGLGLVESHGVVLRVEFDQKIARLHRLIIFRMDRNDCAIDAGRERMQVANNLRVVGVFVGA